MITCPKHLKIFPSPHYTTAKPSQARGNKMWHCLKFHKLLSSIMLLLTYDIKHSTDKISETYKFSFHWKNIIKCFPTINAGIIFPWQYTEDTDWGKWWAHVENVACGGGVLRLVPQIDPSVPQRLYNNREGTLC